ncbi:hypothetical protein AB0953_31345 [Streptomyces sp. NPDC046866]|uniref:hypothetical protein n=1 Tax=Streptomyces sp. NPDC046866 TaxID=3154921 RepID=UPI003456D9CF
MPWTTPAHGLKVDDSGRVQLSHPVMVPQGSTEHLEPVNHPQGIIADALGKAPRADADTARALRTIEGLTAVSDPKLAQEALTPGSPLAIALALSGGTDGLHPINVSPAQFPALDRAAAETGVSRKLLLAILWQEQQGYQNFSPGLTGPLAEAGRVFNWTLQQSLKPDKSLGITHMKSDTARAVMENHRRAFTLPDGTFYQEGGGPHTGTGTGPAEPGTPSPSPGPAPRPPRSN